MASSQQPAVVTGHWSHSLLVAASRRQTAIDRGGGSKPQTTTTTTDHQTTRPTDRLQTAYAQTTDGAAQCSSSSGSSTS